MSESWIALKQRLIRKGFLNKFFAEPLDNKYTRPDTRFDIPDDAYFPLLMETHLRDVSSHLDRVLSYRREMRELEIQAVRAACDYALQRDQSKTEHDLALIRLRNAQNSAERTAQEKAVSAFGKGTGEVAGFKEIATGSAARLALDLDDADKEARLLTEMYTRDRAYQDAYWQRHNEPGNAHNFGERARQLLALIRQDKTFAECKCRALNVGFRAIYGRDPQSKLPANGSIDDLVMWVRDLFEDIGIEDELESEFDMVVPLVQPQSLGKGLVSKQDWNKALDKVRLGAKLELAFELKKEHLLNRDNLRLRRIGLSYGTTMGMVTTSGIDSNATYESYCRYRGELVPPPQAVRGVRYKRPSISLGGIALYTGPVDFAEGPEVINLNPIGKWRTVIEPNPTAKDAEMRTLLTGSDGSTDWLDVKLHMRLRG